MGLTCLPVPCARSAHVLPLFNLGYYASGFTDPIVLCPDPVWLGEDHPTLDHLSLYSRARCCRSPQGSSPNDEGTYLPPTTSTPKSRPPPSRVDLRRKSRPPPAKVDLHPQKSAGQIGLALSSSHLPRYHGMYAAKVIRHHVHGRRGVSGAGVKHERTLVEDGLLESNLTLLILDMGEEEDILTRRWRGRKEEQ